MKENVLDVLMYLFENYFYDELEDEPDRASMEENLHEAGFSNGEIGKAFNWLDGLAEQRFQPEFKMQTDQPIRIFVDFETTRIDTACLDFIMYLSNVSILDAQRRESLVVVMQVVLPRMIQQTLVAHAQCPAAGHPGGGQGRQQ